MLKAYGVDADSQAKLLELRPEECQSRPLPTAQASLPLVTGTTRNRSLSLNRAASPCESKIYLFGTGAGLSQEGSSLVSGGKQLTTAIANSLLQPTRLIYAFRGMPMWDGLPRPSHREQTGVGVGNFLGMRCHAHNMFSFVTSTAAPDPDSA